MPARASNRLPGTTPGAIFFEPEARRLRSGWWHWAAVSEIATEPLTSSDADLVPPCRRGDEAAWRELVTRHTRRVFGLAYRFTGRVDEAEDLTQEVFVKVYQTLDRYREADGPFQGWLMAVARNHAIDHYRRRKQERLRRTQDPQVLETMPAGGEHPIAGLEREERARLVHSGLRALPAELRLPLILCDLQGLPYEEIADALQIPLGTVKSRINRARLELARRLLRRRHELGGA
jgi:RNA polymerase sigma-70 factor (ECF subfamily)